VLENFFKRRHHVALRRRPARHGRVRRIGQKRQHALVAVFFQSLQVIRRADDRRIVNFVIAGVNDRADRRFDRQRKTIHQRMRSVNKLDFKAADFDRVVRADAMKQNLVHHLVLFQFFFRQRKRKTRGVNRKIEFFQQKRQRADMVFVPVREDQSGQFAAIFFQKIEIGNGNVHSVRRLFGKSHPGVNDNHFVAAANAHTIHPEFADAAERDDLYFTCHFPS
jgi:hypothetical protein